VLAVARILGIELELKVVNLMAKEQLQPEFVKVSLLDWHLTLQPDYKLRSIHST